MKLFCGELACENSHLSLLLAAFDILQGGTSGTHQQKFHTDDVNQCLHNKSGSHGVPNANLFNFTFLLVDFGKVLCSSANELQQNSNASSREEYTPKLDICLRLSQWTMANNSVARTHGSYNVT